MKVAFHDYTLQIKGINKFRYGALARFSFEGHFGYAACHPLPELGDAPLEVQKQKLRKGELTNVTIQTVQFAELDAQARSEGRSLFSSAAKLKNHFLIMDIHGNYDCSGFDYVKIKLSGCDSEIAKLKELKSTAPHLKWRLDFNSKLTPKMFCKFLDSIDLSSIDFIEDPFPFDELLWRKIEDQYQIQLAADFEKKNLREWLPKVLIVKPAIESLALYKNKKARIIVTSCLAHPFEQLTAAYSALQLDSKEIMGLFSHKVYENNSFSECLGNDPSTFFQNLGTGFGFDSLLENLEWHD